MNNPPAPTAPPVGAAVPTAWQRSSHWLVVRLLRLRVWLTKRGRSELWESNYFWAAIVGVCGACSSVLFREALTYLERVLYRVEMPLEYVPSALGLAWWQRLLIPATGGLLAGAILLFGKRFSQGHATDFMEAIVLGKGEIRVRATLVKSFSSLVTIVSGGSIGREGPMVQLASMLGSLVGRRLSFSPAQLRLLVACGSAAGIACAYNAPLTGAFFVAEIVLGSIAMESIGPLIVASVVATVVASQFLGNQPVYRMPYFGPVPNWQLVAHVGLGILAGLLAPVFLLMLRAGEWTFRRMNLPLVLRLAVGGLMVGVISLYEPPAWNGGGVWGNGYGVVESVLNTHWLWWALVLILVAKILATAATTGSGAVGGVFTPTLFCGAVLGSLFGLALQAWLPGWPVSLGSFAVVGMGCFLSAITRAPIMSILIMFEMTHDDATIMPLMLACVTAFYVAGRLDADSIYSRQLRANEISGDAPIFLLHVRDLMKQNPVCVQATARFGEIAQTLAANTHKFLYVVDAEHRFIGAIALQDLKPFLNETDFPDVIIALDLAHDDIPVLTSDASLKESLEVFGRHDGERLPVIANALDRRLVGSLAKTDVLLTMAHGKAR